jgi:hypothetical protein
MKNRDQDLNEFPLKMNLMVQNLLISAMGTCKFVMQHTSHPLNQAIREFKLFDQSHFDSFFVKVRGSQTGQTLVLSLKDEILIYTALDITCKTYLTDLGDRMEQLNAPKLENARATFAEIRKTILQGCQFVMEGMREKLSGLDEFDDRADILDNYVLVN